MYNELNDLIKSLAKAVDDNEKISLPYFGVKLASAQRKCPGDYTIGMVSQVINKMANSNNLFISRAEVKDLYQKFYSRNNKFAELFEEELGIEAEKAEKIIPKESTETLDLIQRAFADAVDPLLESQLKQAFGGTDPIVDYSQSAIKEAIRACAGKLSSLGFNAKCSLASGKEGVLVCSASFETPRGTTSVLIPVEFTDKWAHSPSVFVSNAGVSDLTKDNLFDYLVSHAGEKLKTTAQEVLQASKLAKEGSGEVSNVDLIVQKFAFEKEEAQGLLGEQIVGITVDSANPNTVIDVPSIEHPEIASLAKQFNTEIGFAKFTFGPEKVIKASEMIKAKLASFGIQDANIAVATSNENSVTYSVSINGGSAAFKVPVAIEAQVIFPPNAILCNGSMLSFDKTSIASLLSEAGFDRSAAKSASPMYGVKPSELVKAVKEAIASNNYFKAEDALNILAQSDDEKAYQIALTAFITGMKAGKAETKIATTTKCARIVSDKHSQHEICGHTGLPLHKVYQDRNGHCSPLYRQNMENSSEGMGGSAK